MFANQGSDLDTETLLRHLSQWLDAQRALEDCLPVVDSDPCDQEAITVRDPYAHDDQGPPTTRSPHSVAQEVAVISSSRPVQVEMF
jgi:hypothetical protein